ncbi:carbonic anhydrase [Melanomma pulvis-pyrius CBS 109.77]|uniref:Carbonic anhydrase n=1 Tax=Melanomma pulvis-pyrius CBS 109.77 TaxID=1314802 RepID=A0A6A6WQR9_9PLEO|nr:carbonic anhydrase [Melanomma pulvis-pyrius CBS 109.77]
MLLKALLIASTASATCLHGLSKFKRQEPAEGGVEVGTFGYTGLIGPLNWASLAPENEACKTGKNQSPINIDAKVALATEKPTLDIPEQPVEFENLGTTIEVIVNGTTKFGGSDFRLKQFHMHTPSEHRVNDEYFPLEVHMVHEGVTDPNSLAVISVLFQLTTDASNPLLSGLQPHLAAIATPGTKTEIESLDFASLIEHVQTTELFQYTGSLTTPPCAEGLTFLVTKQPLAIDVNTFNEIKSIVKFNSRYSQNSLGEENLVAVAGVAGTAQQFNAPVAEQPAAAAEAAPVTKGQTITITELHGKPTNVVGVVVK